MRTTNKTKAFCLTALSLLAISCDEEDHATKFTDISIEDVESVWRVRTEYPNEGISLGDDCIMGYDTVCWRYLFFFNDGTGVSYNIYHNSGIDSSFFNYQTDDACHFTLKTGEEREFWTFAQRKFHTGGEWIDHTIIYKDTLVNGNKLYTWYDCDEIRTDSTLYRSVPYFRHWRHVPANREWKDKNIAGKYDCTCYGALDIRNATFGADGKFTFEMLAWGDTRKGKYEVILGTPDSLRITYEEGISASYPLIVEEGGFYIYEENGTDYFCRM